MAALAESLAEEEVSILVNNAGIAGPVAPLTDVSVDDWDEVFAVNVRGVFLMCRAFLPPMVARGGGDIINVASVSGKRPLAAAHALHRVEDGGHRPDHHAGPRGRSISASP